MNENVATVHPYWLTTNGRERHDSEPTYGLYEGGGVLHGGQAASDWDREALGRGWTASREGGFVPLQRNFLHITG